MDKSIAIVGAPSSIGIRPYDTGETRQLDRAPAVLRELGLVQRLRASDLGDVIPPAYRDYVRPPGRARNEAEVAAYCRTLGERVEAATSDPPLCSRAGRRLQHRAWMPFGCATVRARIGGSCLCRRPR